MESSETGFSGKGVVEADVAGIGAEGASVLGAGVAGDRVVGAKFFLGRRCSSRYWRWLV